MSGLKIFAKTDILDSFIYHIYVKEYHAAVLLRKCTEILFDQIAGFACI